MFCPVFGNRPSSGRAAEAVCPFQNNSLVNNSGRWEVLYTIHTNGASAYGHGCKVENRHGYLRGFPRISLLGSSWIEAPHALPPSHGCMMQIADGAPSVVQVSFHAALGED